MDALASLLRSQQVVIGVGDMAVSNNREVTLCTYGLGSCIGLVAYDPIVGAGGMLHLMLPDSTISPDKAAAQPAMFADTGLPLFFRQLASFRSQRNTMRLFIAGGANVILGHDPFRIGERNQRATLDFLSRNGFTVARTQVGGSVNRTLFLNVGSGKVTVKSGGTQDSLSLAA